MAALETFEARLQVMNLLAGIVGRMGADVAPCASQIVAPLGAIWQQCDEQNLLRGAILKLLTELVAAVCVGDASASITQLQPMLVGVAVV